jgi:hypothetical protein
MLDIEREPLRDAAADRELPGQTHVPFGYAESMVWMSKVVERRATVGRGPGPRWLGERE